MKIRNQILMGLRAISVFDKELCLKYYNQINLNSSFLNDDVNFLDAFGQCEEKFAKYDNALEYYKKSLGIRVNILGEWHIDLATFFYNGK